MTADTVNACPPKINSKFRIRLIGRTDRVSAIRSQNGHASQSVMPRRLHVVLLITFTLEPSSTMHPMISCPWSTTLISSCFTKLYGRISVPSSLICRTTFPCIRSRSNKFSDLSPQWNWRIWKQKFSRFETCIIIDFCWIYMQNARHWTHGQDKSFCGK